MQLISVESLIARVSSAITIKTLSHASHRIGIGCDCRPAPSK